MKKEDVTGLLVYLIIFGFAIIFGFTVLREFSSKSGYSVGEFFGYIIGAIAAGLIFNSILFELGHILGAVVGRYNILSVNILGLMFYKKDKKLKIKLGNFEGLTGETKISPKQNAKKEPNPTPYLLFGTLFFLVEIIVLITVFVVLNEAADGNMRSGLARTAYFYLVIGVIGFMILIYNVMPFKLDTVTDGYRLTMVSNPKNKEAFNELLRVQNAIESGEKNVEIKTFTTITNFTADLNLNKVYALLDQGKYDEALPFIDSILNSKDSISNRTYIRTKSQKIYIDIMTKSLEEAQEFYDKEVPHSERKLISEDTSMPSIRAYILMSGLLDKSLSETELALNKVLKAYKRTNKARQETELKLYNEALKRVIDAHPNWNLEGFLLEEKEEEKEEKN